MANLFQALIAVTCAMFGVRSSKGFEEDKKLSIFTILLTGFVMVCVFLVSLILIIKFVVLA